ncbi:MAG: Fic family protein [Saprospiraceae bacterium]
MKIKLQIIPLDLLDNYISSIERNHLIDLFENLMDAEISTDTFSFYNSVSSVFSSKIEGEEIELDSYIKHKKYGIEFQPDYTKKIDDLYNAYTFASKNILNKQNIEKVHKILSKHLIATHQQGKIRTNQMVVTTFNGRIEYVAVSQFELKTELKKFYKDIDTLLMSSLSIVESFFFAAMIHLVFVKIHPFNDGNGRTGRLLEKWFLAQKLGEKAWFVQSEKYYYQNHESYYNNLRVLGLEYIELDYTKALPFLLMLPSSIKSK